MQLINYSRFNLLQLINYSRCNDFTTCSILDSEIFISSLDLFTCDDVTIAPGPQLQALGLFQRYNTLSLLKKQQFNLLQLINYSRCNDFTFRGLYCCVQRSLHKLAGVMPKVQFCMFTNL